MRVLLALNDSLEGAPAKDEAASRAWPPGTIVRVLAVLHDQPPPPIIAGPPPAAATLVFPDSDDAAHKALLAEVAATADSLAHKLGQPRTSVETSVRRGSPGPEIVDEAREWAADLIVLGPDNRTGLDRVLTRNIDTYVVSHAPCSVEVVRPSPTSQHQ